MKAPTAVPAEKDMPSAELQRLWFATLKKDWSSLVVLPAHPGGDAIRVGRALAQVAALHKDVPIKLISGEGADLQNASRLIIDMTTHVASGGHSRSKNAACFSKIASCPRRRKGGHSLQTQKRR